MNKNSGVSIITLIITIIVIIILASFTIYYGLTKNTQQAVETKTVYEVHEIVDAITNRSLLNDLNSSYYNLIGNTEFPAIEIKEKEETKVYSAADGWYLIEEEEDFRELGLDNTTGSYLVNYDDGSIVAVNGIVYKENVYYSVNELKVQMGGGTTILSKVEYDLNKGVNMPVLSKGMIPVKLHGDSWVVTSTDDQAWYDYSAGEKAWANVMLMDQLEVEGYDNDVLKTASLTELIGKKVTKEGSAYVWIPRYTATADRAKIIFSNLVNDTTNSNGENYTCPSSFTFGSGIEAVELTGIWVSKYEAGFSE